MKELRGRHDVQNEMKKGIEYVSQDFCQACGDGKNLVSCSRCPVSFHPECSGVKRLTGLVWCHHHHCSVCRKPASMVGGLMYPCSSCPNAYCEDHLPTSARVLEDGCEQMERLGYDIKNGVYVHCSEQCEQVAILEFAWKVGKRFQRASAVSIARRPGQPLWWSD